jgi:hypothetical protein
VAGVRDERGEQAAPLARELEHAAVQADLAPALVDLERRTRRTAPRGGGPPGAAQDRAHARHELARREGFAT